MLKEIHHEACFHLTQKRLPNTASKRDKGSHGQLLTEVCHDVCIEPNLQSLTGEALPEPSSIGQDGARLDIAASGCWGGRHERTYFDVRVFTPHAPSNRCTDLSTCYRKHERIKKNAYEQRIREVAHASFTPLVLAASRSHFYVQQSDASLGLAPVATTPFTHQFHLTW